MPNLDDQMSALAEQVLSRPLTEEEKLKIYKISDAMGMSNVQSFLYLLLVFQLYEDTLSGQFERLNAFEGRLSERFQEIASLETQINDTLEGAVDRILGEGATKIGANMSNEIASQTRGIFSAVGAYHALKGQILVACVICGAGALGYFLGLKDVLRLAPGGGIMEALLFMPAGWCFFLCGVTYTFLWIGDNWINIKRRKLYKAFLGVQIFILLLFVAGLV